MVDLADRQDITPMTCLPIYYFARMKLKMFKVRADKGEYKMRKCINYIYTL